VSTLYALVTELGGSFDEVLFGEPPLPPARQGHTGPQPQDLLATILAYPRGAAVQRADARKTIQLSAGVRWERLTSHSVPGVEFLLVSYAPGAESGPPDTFQRHAGREWCYVVSGTLELIVGFDEHVLQAGDAITYDAATPHRLCNPGPEALDMIWFQLG
jgi:mannose-6-phosphate isomerase-like protein (cupin superfamily)